MPNLVTIIFAILVAPSKSLDAPKMHNKRRLMPYYKWPKYTVNIIRQVLEYFTVCIAVLSSSQFSTKTVSYKEKYYLIKRKSMYLLSGYQSVKILWNYTNSFFALQTLLLKLFFKCYNSTIRVEYFIFNNISGSEMTPKSQTNQVLLFPHQWWCSHLQRWAPLPLDRPYWHPSEPAAGLLSHSSGHSLGAWTPRGQRQGQ